MEARNATKYLEVGNTKLENRKTEEQRNYGHWKLRTAGTEQDWNAENGNTESREYKTRITKSMEFYKQRKRKMGTQECREDLKINGNAEK